MTNIQKRKAEKFLDNAYSTCLLVPTDVNESFYMSARSLVGAMGLYWHRDKQGKHHIF